MSDNFARLPLPLQGDVPGAINAFNAMIKVGIKPDIFTFSSLIVAYLKKLAAAAAAAVAVAT